MARRLETPLRRARSIDDFLRDPMDAYATEPGWLVFLRPALSGVVLWGVVDGAAVRQLARFLELRCALPPHASFLDARLDSLDASAFETRKDFIDSHGTAMRHAVSCLAIVKPEGVLGALVEGIRLVSPPPFPERFFTDPREAFAWLGAEHDAALLDQLTAIRAETLVHDPCVQKLRVLLDADLELSLTAAAHALAMSERSLQRRLARDGTSYQAELARARVRRAQRLLSTTEASISEVAVDVGCASPQHLNKLFRKFVHVTPTEWRKSA